MNQPTESELLASLDRRARAATDDLTAAVAAIEIPEQGFAEPARARRFLPLAVAAALVVVALVGAVLVRTGGDEDNGAVAGQPSLTHLVLPDPEAAGYELSAAFDGTETTSGVEPMNLSVTVQGPSQGDDPWSAGVLAYALPGDLTTLGGEAVDLGGPDASYATDGIAPTVGWVDGDEVRYLVSSSLDRDQLIALAAATIASGTPVGAPLPDRRILFAGSATDVFPTLGMSIGAPRGLSGVAYRELTGDNALVVATRNGDDARWRAASVAASTAERVTVRGHDAVVARFGQDLALVEVTWLESDGTLVRAGAALTPDTGALVTVLDQLEPIGDDEFARLVRSQPVGPGVEEPVSEEPVSEDSGGPDDEPRSPVTTSAANLPVASVMLQDGRRHYMASLTRAADGSHVSLEAAVTTSSDSSGGSADLPGIDSEGAVRNDQPDGTVVIAVLVGPRRGPIEVRDGTTDEAITYEGGSEATIEGSDHTVVLLVVRGVRADQQLVLVDSAPDGREIRIRV